jgi:hypothetical protein
MESNQQNNHPPSFVIDYASPRRSRWMNVVIDSVERAWWFFAHRNLSAFEVAIGSGIAWTALYVFWAVRRFELGSDALKPALALTWILPVVMLVAVVRLALKHQWRALWFLPVVIALTMPLAGMIQSERCPHARYLQVLGISIPLEGTRCGNPRHIEPWWMRE